MSKPADKPAPPVPGVNHPIPFETMTFVSGGWVSVSGLVMPNGTTKILSVSTPDVRPVVLERAKINFARNVLAQERKA